MTSSDRLMERLRAEDMLTLKEALALLRVPPDVLDGWIDSRRVIGVAHAHVGFRLPRWQFEQPLLETVPKLFKALGSNEPWSLLVWLETPHGALDGCTPRAAIERGKVDRALQVARYGD